MQELEFQDTNVLITGAGRGIGKRLAIGFAAAGARVGLLARSKAELDLTQLEIEHAGGKAFRLRADVTDYDQVETAVNRMRAHFGEIDVLVCAAGVQGPVGPFLENSPKAWHEVFNTNVIGVMNASRAVLGPMVSRRKGKIIALTGGGSQRPRPYFCAYAASKAALARFVESLAEELRDHNVQVNCMGPGGAYTHMTDEILKAGDKAGARDLEDAMRIRLTGGVPAEKQIALALFLASQRSNHISGKLVHVDDDWKRLADGVINPELYTLRRVVRI